MASEVDICNLALSRIGDSATVVSINPPEASAQAQHCARFYPIARNSLLERHAWGFSLRRVSLPLLTVNPSTTWAYAYGCPSDVTNFVSVLAPDAADDYSVAGVTQAQKYAVEIDSEGNYVLLTNQENAVLRYTGTVTDTTKFSGLFVDALSWQLAAYLAGAMIKGDTGFNMAAKCAQYAEAVLSKAIESDANQTKLDITHVPAWISDRGVPTFTYCGRAI
jgi:hypothetical protein